MDFRGRAPLSVVSLRGRSARQEAGGLLGLYLLKCIVLGWLWVCLAATRAILFFTAERGVVAVSIPPMALYARFPDLFNRN
jgi:hypothetical protein